jgi:Zn-dependent protease
MQKVFKQPFLVFAIFSGILAAIFFLFPISIFDGEIVVESGLQNYTADFKLSLSNFIGIGIEGMEESGIVDFYLKPQGYIIAGIMIFGMPALFAYRMYLKVSNKREGK